MPFEPDSNTPGPSAPTPTPIDTIETDNFYNGNAVLNDPWGALDSPGVNEQYAIATVALMAIATISAIVLCILSLTRARRRADPARFAAPWLKLASAFLMLQVPGIIMALASYSIVLYLIKNDPAGYSGAVSDITMAALHMNLLWELFDFVAQACILVTLASIALGARAVSRHGVSSWSKPVRWVVIAMAAIIVALGIVTYGIRVSTNNHSQETWRQADLIRAGDQTSVAASILVWLTSLGVAGLSVLAMSAEHRTAGILLVVANFLNFLGTTWVMAYYIRWRLEYRAVPLYVPILHAVLNMWTSLGVIFICFVILAKRAGGIWTVGAYGDQHERVSKDSRWSAGQSTVGRPSQQEGFYT